MPTGLYLMKGKTVKEKTEKHNDVQGMRNNIAATGRSLVRIVGHGFYCIVYCLVKFKPLPQQSF